MHNGNCYTNGSYFFDSDIKGTSNSIKCVLPGTTLNGGEWVTPSNSSVECNTDPLHCNVVSSPDASISLFINGDIELSDDGWYKCCLPSDCSDPNTNIIFANIYCKCSSCYSFILYYCIVWVQIEDISVDLPSDITVLPQTYTLHAVKIGQYYIDSADWYYETASTSIELCSVNNYQYNCTNDNGIAIDKGNGRWEYSLIVTWDGDTINSGILSQSSNNADHEYRFYLNASEVMRNHSITITGN